MATAWTDMIKRGCDIAWVLRVEGIPVLFTERGIKRADSASAVTLPSGYTAACPALLISDRDRVSVELDRQEGVARGDAWDIMLAWNALEDDGLLDDLFSRPSAKTALLAIPDGGSDSVLEYNQTTIKVVDNSVFSGGQTVYLGRETITVGAIDGDGVSLTGCTRGVAGYVYNFDSQSISNYRLVTNRPALWRGRFVELHAHLVSPEGRIIDSTWMTGDYHRCLWRGYVDSPPMPDQHGMRLRALPLVRLAANDVGFESTATLVNTVPFAGEMDLPTSSDEGLLSMLIYAGGNGAEKVQWSVHYLPDGGSDTVAVSDAPTTALAAGIHPLGNWLMTMESALVAWLVTDLGIADYVYVTLKSDGVISVQLQEDSGYTISGIFAYPTTACYWLPQKEMAMPAIWSSSIHKFFKMDLQPEAPAGGWVAVSPQSGSGIQDVTIPAAGLGVIEGQEAKEIVRWKAKDETLLTDYNIVMLHMTERQINGTPLVPFATGGKLSVLAGHVGTAASVINTVLQSSGTAQRGSSDTLDLGQGVGVPAAWIDTTSLTSWQLSAYPIQAVNTGRSSLASMVGGWLALAGLNLAQVVDSSGECKITVVGVQPMGSNLGPDITTADVLLESVGSPQVVSCPNEVKVNPSGLQEMGTMTVRDAVRIQGEGPRSWEVAAPSMPLNVAQGFAQGVIAQGDGQAVISLTLGAWVDIQPGATCKLTIAHPAMFDWGTGARAPSTVYARCVGWDLHLASGKQRVTLLLAAGALDVSYLTPSLAVGSKSSDTLTMATPGSTSWFLVDDYVELYTPGDEASERETLRIESMSEGSNTITFTTTPASWVGAGTVVTHAPYASATDVQKLDMYVRTEKTWGF